MGFILGLCLCCSCLLGFCCLKSGFLFLLSFLGFHGSKALLDLLKLVGSMNEILDRAGRALNNAHAALLALFVVNDSEVVFDVDRVEFTGSLAHAAADAGDGAILAGIRTLLGVVAADKDFCLIVGNDLDQAVGAGLDAGAAACALVAVYDSDALDDMDGIKFAGSFAVAQSQTSVGAGFGAAEELLGSLTGRDICIFIQFLGIVGSAVAHDIGNFLFHAVRTLAQDRGKFLGTGRAADRTLGAGDAVGIFDKCMRIVIASCVTAAAAVGAGQLCTHEDESLVFLNMENSGGESKSDRSNQADNKNECDRNNDLAHQLPPFLREHSAESHKAQGHDSRCQQDDRNALEGLGNAALVNELAADARHDDHGEKETEAGAEGVEEGLGIVVTAVDVADADTEDGAVGCDQGKENTERLIEANHVFLHEHLDQLNECSDNENENDRLEVADALAVKELLDRPCNSCCQYHNEGNSDTHTSCTVHILGDTQEGADAQELRQRVVIDEDHADNDDHIFSHKLCP